MARLGKGRGEPDLTLKSDTDTPIYLKFDRERFSAQRQPFRIQARYVPNEPGNQGDISLQEWTWSNGTSGAGTTIETPESYAGGASEYGERVWLRRKGVAMPAGELYEYPLPALTAAFTTGQFTAGCRYGSDLWITTLNRTVIRVPGSRKNALVSEKDFGATTQTEGLAMFAGAGSSYMYVGEFTSKIREWNGSAWTDGAALTGVGWLESVYWTIGSQLATGGASGDSGEGAERLIGTNAIGTGFYHVSGDPKVAANWSDLQPVGAGGTVYPIVRTVANNRTIWFGTGRGVLGIDGLGYSPNLTKWMESAASINNMAALVYWNGLIWGAHELGLMVFSPDGSRIDIGQFVNFGAKTGAGPIFGRPFCLAPAPDGLYCGYYNFGTDTAYIGCLVIDPDGSYRWSMAEAVIGGQIPTFLQQVIDADGVPGLFIGTVDSDGGLFHVYRQDLPITGDPLTDTANGGAFRAATDWSLTLSRSDGGRPVPKTLRRLSLECDANLGDDYPDNTVEVLISADGADYITQGTATSTRWSATPSSGIVRTTSFQGRLTVHNAKTQPVVIRALGIRYTPHPELTKVKTYPVIFGEGVTGQDPRTVLARLEQTQNEGPIMAIDELGATVEVIHEPGLNEIITEEDPSKPWIVQADVTLSTVRTAAHYDEGDLRDSGITYG
jgi:hypothetical protein